MKNDNKITMHEPFAYYAASSKDAVNTSRTASGGIFMELARPIIKKSGIVFGCILEDDGTCYIKKLG